MPARHRDLLMTLASGQLTVTKHPEGCLMIFPRPVWETFRDRLAATPMFIGNAMDVELDGSSRLLISPELRAAAGLTKEVVLLGMGSRFELWDAERYAAHEAKVMQSAMPDALKDFSF